MPKTSNNLQEVVLTQLRRERRTGFDAFIVVVNTDGKQQFIYKHAISTITPEHPISLYPGEEG